MLMIVAIVNALFAVGFAGWVVLKYSEDPNDIGAGLIAGLILLSWLLANVIFGLVYWLDRRRARKESERSAVRRGRA